MSFFAGILTVLLVTNCLVLAFLVLIQLPKKDAGAGIAFGGGAADALFGAGSGNTLTNITKWATVCFFALALFLDFAEGRLHHSNSTEFEKAVQEQQSRPNAQAPIMPRPTPTQPAQEQSTNTPVMPLLTPVNNAPAPTTTNPPAAPPQSK